MHAEYISVALAVPEPPEVKVNTSKGWVEYGKKHSYWGDLIKLRKNSPTQRSITATKSALLRGAGFSYDQANASLHEFMKNMAGKGKHANTQLSGISADKGFLNGWAVQVIWNQGGDSIAEIHHQPIRTVACGPMNEDGIIEQYWLCRDWKKSSEAKFNPVAIPAFNPENAAKYKVQLYVRMVPSDSNDYYPEPECDAALNYLQLEADLAEFHLSNVQNNFALGNILTVPDDPTDDEESTADAKRKAFKAEVEKNFVGPKGKKLMVLFGINGENAAQVLSYNAQNNDTLYDTYSNLCVEKILAANRVTSPVIVGLPGGASLGGDANTIRAAYELYYNTVVRPEQVDIIEGFLELLAYVKGVVLEGDSDTPALDITTTLPVKQTFSEGLLQDIADVDELRAMVDMAPLEKEQEEEPEEGSGGFAAPTANDPNAAAQASLRGSVGGVTAILDVIERLGKQVIDRESALGILKNLFGFTEEQAQEILGTPKELPVGAVV